MSLGSLGGLVELGGGAMAELAAPSIDDHLCCSGLRDPTPGSGMRDVEVAPCGISQPPAWQPSRRGRVAPPA